TMGNGKDTLYLSTLVPKGKVYAFDIQQESINNTKELLSSEGYSNAQLILDSHANLDSYIKEEIDGGMFNLGFRPGGDKNIHTMADSTLVAVEKAMGILKRGGVLVISVYPGHKEGKCEGELLEEFLKKYDKKQYSVIMYKIINSTDSPFILAVQKSL
ncbi:MAG: class I SAM-dependent methyltransferase, partial [Lachnospiraceae bacterium]|nr:class I SAM-dependent methyltransferase [Lachnospiraceae bacterium]